MGLFFEVKTPEDAILLSGYDIAAGQFRDRVAAAMDAVGAKHPSLQALMAEAAQAVRARPLPSEANSDPAALRRLAKSSLRVEMSFGKIKNFAGNDAAFNDAMNIAQQMRAISAETIGQPAYRPLADASLKAVAAIKPDVMKEMGITRGPRAPHP